MISPKIERRVRARISALEEVLGMLENLQETTDTGADQSYFEESLQGMEKEARSLVEQIPEEADYYNEQANLFKELSAWSIGD